MEYILIIIILSIGVFKYDTGRNKFSNYYYNFTLLVFVLIAGLSYRLGVDVVRYELMFENNYSSLLQFGSLFSTYGMESSEPLWVILNWFVYHTTGEFWVLKLIIAFWVNAVVFWFFKRNTSAPYFALMVYFLLQFFEINFQVLREALAISFFLIALDQFIRYGLMRYFIWIVPAWFFHRFAVVTILFPLFFNIKFDKRIVYILLICLIIAPFTRTMFSLIASMSFLNIIIGERITNLMDSETYGIHTRNIFGILEVLVLFLVPVLLLLKNQKNSILLSLSITYVLTILLKMSAFTILYRLNNYLVFPFAISLSIALQNSLFKCDFSKQTVYFMRKKSMVLLCILLFFVNSINKIISSEDFVMYYPYSSIITKDTDRDRERFYMDLIRNYY